MSLAALTALSPIDGRYHQKVDKLRPVFSEYGLMKQRLRVEVAWLIVLANCPEITEIPAFSEPQLHFLNNIVENFDIQDGEKVKVIEATTNHDVKAIEYYLKEQLQQNGAFAPYLEFVHFACTSEDINNLAYALMLKEARENIILPKLLTIQSTLHDMAQNYADLAMLARTHGQVASPTTLGKEFYVFTHRLQRQIKSLDSIEILGKFNGATGNFNAHLIAYPHIDWPKLAKTLVNDLGLTYNPITTQIESHDYIAECAHNMIRINNILIDLARDCWSYISLAYFKQKLKAGEVGSSTMPHKVNPINFENAEGNLALSNSLWQTLADRLSISRFQRDLVDSTLLRNLGTAFAHGIVAYQNLEIGLDKLQVNTDKIAQDLSQAWEVLAEALQTVMRRYRIEQPYEKLKALTRGKDINQAALAQFIQQLNLPEPVKQELLNLTPDSYIGLAKHLIHQ